jgi:hypothetical protein
MSPAERVRESERSAQPSRWAFLGGMAASSLGGGIALGTSVGLGGMLSAIVPVGFGAALGFVTSMYFLIQMVVFAKRLGETHFLFWAPSIPLAGILVGAGLGAMGYAAALPAAISRTVWLTFLACGIAGTFAGWLFGRRKGNAATPAKQRG